MAGELGKASLDLEANLGPFERNVTAADATSDRLKGTLEALAAVADAAQSALKDVKMGTTQGVQSRVSAEEIVSGVRGISDEARDAALKLDRVHLSDTQAAETEGSGAIINHELDKIRDKATEARLALDGVKMRLGAAGGGGSRRGYGLGPFGAGYGRVGLFGSAVGLGALTAPAAAPGAAALIAGIPAMAAGAAGALGTLALAFSGVFKAIGGNKKAFDDLTASQKQFVLTVRGLDGWLDRLKQIAGQSLFPGLTKGLKAALSPGTVNAIETALVQLGHALGSAGAAWGKYFGSAKFQNIFGPLMQAAARNIGTLSDTLLHLFDALGVLGRAAIPFTNWILTAADKGAKLADSWLRARDATGQLGGAMREAQTSLKLVGGLVVALGRGVIALGAAIYPAAKIAVKLLTDGLNALAGGLKKAKPDIQGALGGVLGLIRDIAKVAGPTLGTLADTLLKLVGTLARALQPIEKALSPVLGALRKVISEVTTPLQKLIHDVIGALEPAIKALAKPVGDLVTALGPVFVGALKVLDPLLKFTAYLIATVATAFGFVIEGAAKALTWIEKHWNGIGGFFKNLGNEIINSFKYVWYLLEQGALKAALAMVEPFSHLPSFLGGWARKAKNSMQSALGKLHPPNMNWSSTAAADGAKTGTAWAAGFDAAAKAGKLKIEDGQIYAPHFFHTGAGSTKHTRKGSKDPKPGTHAWYMKYLGYDPTQQPTSGTPPPFKSTGSGSGKPPVIPGTVSHLIALASQQASIASSTKNAKKEQQALTKEIADLEKADKILHDKWRKAHGKAKTELFNEITSVENKIRAARKKLRDVAGTAQSAKLDYALAQAKVAVENAKEGSKAWDTAVAAEEKALQAEIRYWAKRAHNDKLSLDARTAALKKELAYQKALKALLAPIKAAASANIAQFLSTFADIQNTFGPNAYPVGPPTGGSASGSGKTNTHLHDIKNQAKQTNAHLQAMRDQGRFPGSGSASAAAAAVGA